MALRYRCDECGHKYWFYLDWLRCHTRHVNEWAKRGGK